MRPPSMFASKASRGVSTLDAVRAAKHRALKDAKAAAEAAAREVRVRVSVHARSASGLIAVDNRQFCMTSDPYLVACVTQINHNGVRHAGASAQTRALKRTLAPKWDEWLLVHSLPIAIEDTAPVPPYALQGKDDDSDAARMQYVETVMQSVKAAKAELERKARALTLRLDVFDSDALSDDDPLGHAKVPLGIIIDHGKHKRARLWEIEIDPDLGFTTGMSRKFKTAMTGTLHLKCQIALPALPEAFSVDAKDLLRRLRPDAPQVDLLRIVKLKPFRCPHCTLRFKASKTLRLHLDLHARTATKGRAAEARRAQDRIAMEQQRLDEARNLRHRRKQALLVAQQKEQKRLRLAAEAAAAAAQASPLVSPDSAAMPAALGSPLAMPLTTTNQSTGRGALATASTRESWKEDCRLGRRASMLKALASGFFLVDIRDRHDRKTPLIVSARWGDAGLVKALLLRKASVTAQDAQGNSPLAYAAQYGHRAIVQQLVEDKRGGKSMLAVPNSTGLLPLHRAAMYDHAEVCAYLLSEGADFFARDSARRTALDWARLYKHAATLRVLEDWEEQLGNIVSGGGGGAAGGGDDHGTKV